MLLVAGLLVVVVTVLEALLLPLLQTLPRLALVLVPANLTIAGLVGYFVFASIRMPRSAGHPSVQAMRVVGDTLPLLRQGLNPETAAKAARLMATFGGIRAVIIADARGFLAIEGEAAGALDREALHSQMSRVIESPRPRLVKVDGWPVAIAPLQFRGRVMGALGTVSDPLLDMTSGQDLSRFAAVLSQLLAMQVELGQMDRQAQLVAEAELNALRAQINPHFLFNALNTIISYSRDDPETTRRLLLRLADLFRGSMRSSGQMLPFADEYEQIKNYLYIEQARFRDKLHVVYDIDPQVLKIAIPALSVQPLVENAVRHGLSPKSGRGSLKITARVDFLAMRVVIEVCDDGVGMEPARIPELLRPGAPGLRGDHGLGLANINERLRRLYGDNYRLAIDSSPGEGTTTTLRIPMR
jgi:LytS/YehU family sensor histidine kinase